MAVSTGTTPGLQSAGTITAPVRPSSDVALNSAVAGPQRPGPAGKKWSEVCEQVQKPDGSVRTSPPFKSAATAGTSPPRPGPGFCRRPSRGRTSLYGGITAKDPSRAGSSRGGSSGKSSRSSSRDIARDGDISSRCSSGCWETSTNSSEPVTDIVPSPMESKGLLMPDPIRTGIIPPALLADEHVPPADAVRVDQTEQPGAYKVADSEPTDPLPDSRAGNSVSVGMPLKWDPFGRDGACRQDPKAEWTPDSLTKYLKGVAIQIDDNLSRGHLPTADRLDNFVHRLVIYSHRQFKHAPKKVRHKLAATFTTRFQTFWNFSRNEKVRNITPEELKGILLALVENLSHHDLTLSEQPLAQPKPMRYYSYGQVVRPESTA
mmetsp:Transcript_13471/g.31947  ORF Transcript_13471/g.31947 Transcript_13471/m.31947 type:complete len:376 (-) Transcript_13471:72-1199(-)